jgi:trans-aconitate methyltransferase
MYRTSESTTDNWNAHWDDFASYASENPAQDYRHRTLLNVLKKAGIRDTVRLLDIGSGQGDFLHKAANLWPAAELVGLELSQTGVMISRRKVPRARVFVADVFARAPETDALEGWAEAAVCSEVLEHVDDPVAFLHAANFYLGPGAFLVITVPSGPVSSFDRHIGHRQHFTPGEIAGLLSAAGFEVQQVVRAGFPFFNLYRRIVIARGEKLVQDLRTQSSRMPLWIGRLMMAMFRVLFLANFLDSPFGWQIVAIARKAPK